MIRVETKRESVVDGFMSMIRNYNRDMRSVSGTNSYWVGKLSGALNAFEMMGVVVEIRTEGSIVTAVSIDGETYEVPQ